MYLTELATLEEQKIWDQIIAKCSYSEALHTYEWHNALKGSFSQMKSLYLLVKDDNGNMVSAMPCFIFQPIPFIRSLSSMPWTLPGGVLIFSEVDKKAIIESVSQKINEIAKKNHFTDITITFPAGYDEEIIDGFISNGFSDNEKRFTHILELGEGYESVWNSYNKRVRGAVRKAEKSGVIIRETEDESDMMAFYKMYLGMMRHFNSTPKPYSLLRYLQISPIARLVVAELNKRMIGGLLFLHFNRNVRLWCETSDPDFLSHRPNNAVINYIIKWSCDHGYNVVDFGASPIGNDGLIAFKEEWGAKMLWFNTLYKAYSQWRRKLWAVAEPSIRRVYAEIQRFRL
ncbi:MAG: GNAT family N-acetyltransferase [Candidatus Poribacteria bacterium]